MHFTRAFLTPDLSAAISRGTQLRGVLSPLRWINLRRILSDQTIIQRPDCLFSCNEQSASCVMIAHVKLDDRLSILRARDRFRRWNSLDDQRVCSICERKFKGRQVEIRRVPGGQYRMLCPTLGCPSGPHQWLYPRAAVVSEVIKPDLWRGPGEQSARRPAQSIPQAGGHRV
jgi:hypothetical protein